MSREAWKIPCQTCAIGAACTTLPDLVVGVEPELTAARQERLQLGRGRTEDDGAHADDGTHLVTLRSRCPQGVLC
jgi:hypothetical protein